MNSMLIIATKEIVQSVRDIKTFVLIVFMPTVLTFILGIAFSDNFDKSISLDNVNIYYELDCSEEEKEAFSNFVDIVDKLGANQSKNIKDKSMCEIHIKVHSFNNIDISYQNGYERETNVVRGLLMSFLDRGISINILKKLGNVPVIEMNEENILYSPINRKGVTKSLDYYGITMVTLTSMFFSISSAYKILSEKQNRTLNRIMYSNVPKRSVVIGKLIGCIIIVILQLTVVVSISSMCLNVNWGNNIHVVMLVLVSLGFLSASLGNMLGIMLNDYRTVWILLLSFIMILGFLSGAYIPTEYLNISFVDKINIINPLAITNKTIFSVIYGDNMKMFVKCIIVNFLYTAVFTEVSLKCRY